MKIMKTIYIISLIIIFILQPVSAAENSFVSQPTINHSFSIKDLHYILEFKMSSPNIADPSKSTQKYTFINGWRNGGCSLGTYSSSVISWGISFSPTEAFIDLRTNAFGLDLDFLVTINRQKFSSSSDAFDSDTDNPYFCYKVQFTFGFAGGNSLLSNEFLVKIYENEAPNGSGTGTGFLGVVPIDISMFVLAIPLLILIRGKKHE